MVGLIIGVVILVEFPRVGGVGVEAAKVGVVRTQRIMREGPEVIYKIVDI